MDRQLFKVHVHEGRGFGSAPQALICSATFAGEAKTTSYSVASDCHTWNSALAWALDKDAARKATSCKLNILRKDGLRLGWVLIDLRAAKLQHQYNKDSAGTCCVCACVLHAYAACKRLKQGHRRTRRRRRDERCARAVACVLPVWRVAGAPTHSLTCLCYISCHACTSVLVAAGQWLPLMGCKQLDSPQVRISYSLGEEQLLDALPRAASNPTSRAPRNKPSRQQSAEAGAAPAEQHRGDQGASAATASPSTQGAGAPQSSSADAGAGRVGGSVGRASAVASLRRHRGARGASRGQPGGVARLPLWFAMASSVRTVRCRREFISKGWPSSPASNHSNPQE